MPVKPEDIRDLELWLLTPENEIIDFRSSSSFPHRFESENDEAGYFDELKRVIDNGESETCEFKSYIRVGATKASELAKTVCAFSNQRGGRLFIGVSDEGEVDGMAKDLRGDFPGQEYPCGDYIKKIRKTLREGLNDNQCFRVERAERYGKVVVVIVVEKAAELNYLHAGNQAYIRRGATDRKMTPPEIQSQSSEGIVLG